MWGGDWRAGGCGVEGECGEGGTPQCERGRGTWGGREWRGPGGGGGRGQRMERRGDGGELGGGGTREERDIGKWGVGGEYGVGAPAYVVMGGQGM